VCVCEFVFSAVCIIITYCKNDIAFASLLFGKEQQAECRRRENRILSGVLSHSHNAPNERIVCEREQPELKGRVQWRVLSVRWKRENVITRGSNKQHTQSGIFDHIILG